MPKLKPLMSAALIVAAIAAWSATIILAGLARHGEPTPPAVSIDTEQMTRDAKRLPEQSGGMH